MTAFREDFENQMNQGNFSGANAVLLDMQKADSKSQIFLESQGRYLVRRRDYTLAREALKQCLTAFPKSKSCLVDLASTELQIGTKEEQAEAIRQCLSVVPNDPQCRNMSGINLINSGNYNEAIKVYEELLKDNGNYGFRFDNGMLNWQMALALDGVGRSDEALEHFEQSCRQSFSEACKKLEELSGGAFE
ncbi:MAG: tetratricopeptide repeat protein [Bdellovibrionaceae bacterium]|nr:tetratricopeptide repeat protein [Pseudobdellovibrionaceae bacterium]